MLLGHSAFGVYCLIENHLFLWLNKKFDGKKKSEKKSLIIITGGAEKAHLKQRVTEGAEKPQAKQPVTVWN